MHDEQVYELKINQSVRVRGVWLYKAHVLYAGMPNESTYSLVLTYTNCHNSIAYNLFIPKSQSEVTLPRGKMVLRRVSPTGISFTFENRDVTSGKTPI